MWQSKEMHAKRHGAKLPGRKLRGQRRPGIIRTLYVIPEQAHINEAVK